MGKIKHRTQIYLDEQQYKYIKEQALENNISIAEYIRRLINKSLPGEKDYEQNPLFNIGNDDFCIDREDGSSNHDDYIYRGKQ